MSYEILMIHRHDVRCENVCQILRNYFLSHDFKITYCDSYEEAFGELMLKAWDLILIDSHLSHKKNALETLKHVRGILNNPDIPTILFGNPSDPLAIDEAKAHGADDFLTHADLSAVDGQERLLGHLFKLNKTRDYHPIN